MTQEEHEHPARICLNHVYVNLDEESLGAICASSFIQKEYAPFWQNTITSEVAGTYTGAFLAGENTYIELFGSNSDEGNCGICFGIEEIGTSPQVCGYINRAFDSNIAPLLNHFIDGEQQIPWYYIIEPPIPLLGESALYTWIMEYHPDIFKHRGIAVLTPGKLTQEAYLSPKRSLLPSAWMKNIVELTVELTPAATSAFATLLRACRYTEIQEAGVMLFCGPAISIRLIAGDMGTKYSVRTIKTSLTHFVEQPIELNFGSKVNLFLNKETAVWSFA